MVIDDSDQPLTMADAVSYTHLLLREFKVEANVGAPQVAYKETFTKPALSAGIRRHASSSYRGASRR